MRCCSVQRNFSPQRFSKKETSLLNLLEEKKETKNWHQGNLLTFPRSELLTPVFQDQQLLILLASRFFIHMAICIPVTPLPVLLHDLLVLAVGGIKSFRRLLFLFVLVRIVSAKHLVFPLLAVVGGLLEGIIDRKDSGRISSKICLPGRGFCKRDPAPAPDGCGWLERA